MKTKIFPFVISILLTGCHHTEEAYSNEDTQLLLQEITKNIEIEPSESFDANNPGSIEILFITRYPLSEKQSKEYNQFGYIKTNTEDAADSVLFRVTNYELRNQDSIAVHFVNNTKSNYLEKYALIKEQDSVYQDLGFELTINSIFNSLEGFVTIEFIMPNKMKKEVTIPVSI